jgi:hypothetical protein
MEICASSVVGPLDDRSQPVTAVAHVVGGKLADESRR